MKTVLIAAAALTLMLLPGPTLHPAAGSEPPRSEPPDRPIVEQTGPPTISPPISDRGGGDVGALAFAPDGKTLATGNGDGLVRFYDPVTARERAPAWDTVYWQGVNNLAYSPDGSILAVGIYTDGVRLIDPISREIRRTLRVPPPARPLGPAHLQSLATLAFAPDGRTLAGGTSDGQIAVWDVDSGRLLRVMVGPIIPPSRPVPGVNLPGRPAWVSGLAYSPDGKSLAATDQDRTVRVWDPAAGVERFAVKANYAAFSPDGTALAVGAYDDRRGGACFALLDPITGEARSVIRGRNAVALAFLPDAKSLVSMDDQKAVRLWDASDGTQRDALRLEHHGTLDRLAISPNGRTIAVAGEGSAGFFGRIELIRTDGKTLQPWSPGP